MNKERIAQYLAKEVKASDVAAIVGCTPAYISQLLKDDDFRERVQELAQENSKGDSEEESLSAKYIGMEHRLLNSMGDALVGAELPAITRALEVVATRQERKAARLMPARHAEGVNVNIVQLTIPTHAIPSITLNEQREVIAINNKPMSPMSSVGVKSLFEMARKKQIAEEIVQKLEVEI